MDGLIEPPNGIRAVLEKTALFVAKFGPEFEQRIAATNLGRNPKFEFLMPSNEFHGFYQHRLSEQIALLESTRPAAGVVN